MKKHKETLLLKSLKNKQKYPYHATNGTGISFLYTGMRSLWFIYILIISCPVIGQSTFQFSSKSPEWSVEVRDDIVESQTDEIYAVSSVDGGKRDVRLVKIKANGTVLWDTIYDFTPHQEFSPRLVNAHDGGVIVASTSYSYPVDDQDGYKDILVWKINELGEIVWQKVIAARSFHSMIATSDGNYILLGSHYNERLGLLITKIDENGNILWQKIIERMFDKGEIAWVNQKKIVEINGFVYIAAYFTYPLVGSNWQDGLLYQFDLDGNINWEIRIPSREKHDVRMIEYIFKFNDKLYFIADYRDIIETYTFTEQGGFRNITDSIQLDLDGLVIDNSCDGTGDALTGIVEITELQFYFKKYNRLDSAAYYEVPYDTLKDAFAKIIKSRNGGYIMLSQTSGAVLVTKTDCMGNVAYWSEDCNSKIPEGQELLLYPNPVKDRLTIEAVFDFSEVSLINALGQITVYKNECNCNRKLINVSDLASGVYSVLIEGKEQNVTAKFVKF
ncbi:T9SS type A sorting domain-containing protein [Crocinitomix algicola]|uniref:T9SS type A sorting domain-containing protein n=1 Tax=Crocinitomix algicola TaxID=1740263 RepID=UPI000832688E|nr:T9SS type A sorting domain-containing protein [Crocinitomix algicola]